MKKTKQEIRKELWHPKSNKGKTNFITKTKQKIRKELWHPKSNNEKNNFR